MWKLSIYFCMFTVIVQHFCSFSDGYNNIRAQDYLCADKFIIALQKPFRGDPSLTLTEDRDSAAIISQVWNITMPGVHGANKLKYDCEFRVQTPKKSPRGIYIVITKLKFRQDPLTNECIDYIRFSSSNQSPSQVFCNATPMAFHNRDREFNVHIHVDKRRVIHEPLEMKMILTAHSKCKYTSDFLCDPKDPYSCISRHFVRDNITNCIPPCRDEISCYNNEPILEEMDTTNVAISAITSLIFTMLGVGFCVWICWKYWNCITVQQRMHEESAHHRTTTPMDVPEIDFPIANAPNLDEVIATAHDHQPQTPKDLPPSYESLFPDR